jgi:hypothetical protein
VIRLHHDGTLLNFPIKSPRSHFGTHLNTSQLSICAMAQQKFVQL